MIPDFLTGGELIGDCSAPCWRLVKDHLSSRNVVAMVAETANKLSRREVARRSKALWNRGFGLGQVIYGQAVITIIGFQDLE